uniref:CENPJ tubulin-binding region domain-containing protein n=1 Tax=Denticeps clupeoides TaxID=299321 RepID=A0AAY4BY82_9TELE
MSSPEMVIVPSGFLQRWLPSGARSGVVLNASPSSSWSIACQPLEEPCFEHSPMPSSMGLSSTEGQVLEQPLQRRLEQLRQLQRYMQDELENRQKDQHRIMGINYHDTDFPESIPMPVTVLDPQFPQRLESLLQDQEEQRMLEAGERNSYPGSVLEVEEPSPPSEDMLTKTEDRPIKPGLGTNTKTFEELLEEQLKLEEQRLVGKTQKEAPKRPFLRRGEGHTRYKLHPRGTKTSTDKMHLKLASLTGITGQIASDPSANLHRGAVAEGFIPGGQATQVQHKKESHSQPSPNIQGAQQAGQQMLVQGSPRCAAETSFEVWQREKQQECAELNEFELLEVAAEELSFSSNSSFMQALTCRGGWQRRLSSTPMKAQKLNQHIPSHGGSADESLDTSFCSDPAVPLPVVTPPYDKCVYQKAEHNANDISSDANVTLVDNVFDDDDTWTDLLDHSQSAMQPEKTLKRKVAVAKGMGSANPKDSEALPTSQLVAKLFPVLRPKPSPPPVVSPKPQPSSAEHRAAQSQLLRERLVELETEIERFKTENAAFSSLKQEQIQLNKQLRRERDIFEKERREAESAWEEFKREESRKLQREKKLFEKHAAAARAVPSVRDREEMQTGLL